MATKKMTTVGGYKASPKSKPKGKSYAGAKKLLRTTAKKQGVNVGKRAVRETVAARKSGRTRAESVAIALKSKAYRSKGGVIGGPPPIGTPPPFPNPRPVPIGGGPRPIPGPGGPRTPPGGRPGPVGPKPPGEIYYANNRPGPTTTSGLAPGRQNSRPTAKPPVRKTSAGAALRKKSRA